MKTYNGKLIIRVIVHCKRCGNDVEKSYKAIPKQDEVWTCPVANVFLATINSSPI